MSSNYAKRATIQVATDVSTATVIGTEGSDSQTAVDARISGVAADIISSDPTVVAAASAAVDDALDNTLSLSKCVHLEAGKWVWDGPNDPVSTHYVIPDYTGALIVRPNPFPTPLATPALDW